LTDETGSGSVVFNNTPTFITPNLGVANATQYNIGTLTYSASQAFSKLQTDANSFSQVVLQNSNTGTQASGYPKQFGQNTILLFTGTGTYTT